MTSTAGTRNIAPPMQRHTRVQLAVALVTGLACLAIQEYWFGTWHQVVRDWGLHWLAVVASAMATSLLLQVVSGGDGRSWRKLSLLACAVPFSISSLHELGQWIWPKADRDDVDSLRDFALNFVGACIALAVLRRIGPEAPEPRRRQPTDQTRISSPP